MLTNHICIFMFETSESEMKIEEAMKIRFYRKILDISNIDNAENLQEAQLNHRTQL